MTETKARGLTGSTLKWIAIAAMLTDHFAYAFITTDSPLYIFLRFIGKFTAPIMCYFIAEGYHYTRDVKKYALRLAIFAVISNLPYQFFFTMKTGVHFWPPKVNMLFTLLCGLLALWAWDRIQKEPLRILVVSLLCAVTAFSDWSVIGVMMILAFGIFRGDKKKQMIAYTTVLLVMVASMLYSYAYTGLQDTHLLYGIISNLGTFCIIPLPLLYNGQRGGGKISKWLFYIVYPFHLAVFGLIYMLFVK